MTQAEQDLQNALVSQYFANLEFFKEHDLELFNKLNTLSRMIDENYFKENFVLEFVKETGDFDILNLATNTYTYGRNAKLINENFLNNCDFSKKSIFGNLVNNLYLPREKDIEISDSKFDVLDRIIYDNMSEYASILGHCYSDDKVYKDFDKFLFFGNLLGTHLKNFQEKMAFKCCFIYEPNLEIFRLSLFVADYKSLNNKSQLVFSVMDEEDILVGKLNQFFRAMFIYSNYNIKYYKMINVEDSVFHKILSELYLSNGSSYDYTKLLFDTFYSVSKHINKYKILTTKNKSANFSLTNDKPTLLIGAGPSLGKNLKWLKENQDKFILVAIGATYKKLFDNGIIPDIVTTVDPNFRILNRTHFNLNDVELLKNTMVLASINTPTKILDRFNQEKLFLYEVVDTFKNNSNAYNGISIGEITLSLLLDMNVKEIYLLGTDLAFDEKTGSSHFEGYVNKREDFENNKSKVDEVLETGNSSREEFIQVKGNKRDKVVTNRIFALSINQYVRIITLFKKPFQNIYNLCEDGAYIKGTILKNINDIENYKDIEIKDFLFSNLEKISEFGLLKNEFAQLDIKINNMKFIRKTLNEQFKKQKSSNNILKFNDKFLILLNIMLKKNDKFFLSVITNYFNFVVPYINYSLNDKNLENSEIESKLSQIENVFYKQVENIIDIYESYLVHIKKGLR
ncbi:motility accessory factor [Arcobacter venerupis]|uniref:Motility accessory factor n=1 Tax=Arcobacter venerupis TaxID=1054033 RepID=A0AAE7BC90_9BACT|nr:6-hydroxymethylpterin diphosphokinase MptE-like protein [Arcobacter venerupis]QKF68391.1 motility accessory factor [Arcobacter venerupis]RWS49022.1 hypothetical protein CKA56_11420 [Arcobacter venerupis]